MEMRVDKTRPSDTSLATVPGDQDEMAWALRDAAKLQGRITPEHPAPASALPREGDWSTWKDEASGETGPCEFRAGEWRERASNPPPSPVGASVEAQNRLDLIKRLHEAYTNDFWSHERRRLCGEAADYIANALAPQDGVEQMRRGPTWHESASAGDLRRVINVISAERDEALAKVTTLADNAVTLADENGALRNKVAALETERDAAAQKMLDAYADENQRIWDRMEAAEARLAEATRLLGRSALILRWGIGSEQQLLARACAAFLAGAGAGPRVETAEEVGRG